jgi:hypothetical protein
MRCAYTPWRANRNASVMPTAQSVDRRGKSPPQSMRTMRMVLALVDGTAPVQRDAEGNAFIEFDGEAEEVREAAEADLLAYRPALAGAQRGHNRRAGRAPPRRSHGGPRGADGGSGGSRSLPQRPCRRAPAALPPRAGTCPGGAPAPFPLRNATAPDCDAAPRRDARPDTDVPLHVPRCRSPGKRKARNPRGTGPSRTGRLHVWEAPRKASSRVPAVVHYSA